MLRFYLLAMDLFAWLKRVVDRGYTWALAKASDATQWDEDEL